jgi:DNA-binding transcriptional LysR family regulator
VHVDLRGRGPVAEFSADDRHPERLADLGLTRLVSFVRLAEELHFGHAAALLHLSQPALSQQISKLEGRLGTSLFLRGARTVRLTPAGRVLLRACRRVLATMDQAVGAINAGLGDLVLAFDCERRRAYAVALAAELTGLLGITVTPHMVPAADLPALVCDGHAYAGVTSGPPALAASDEVVVEVVVQLVGADPATGLALPSWASRAESARLVETGRAVWRDVAARVQDQHPGDCDRSGHHAVPAVS